MGAVRSNVRRTRAVRSTAALAVAGLVTAGFGVRAGASDPGDVGLATYQVLARADAFTVEAVYASTPVIPGGEVVKASPATSQTVVNSIGQSLGFASAPYPGDFVISGPGTANGALSGTAPPLPYYPFVAYSSFPGEPKAEAAQGPYKLHAESEERKSTAEALMGAVMGAQPSISQASATTSSVVDVTKGELTATADSALDGLVVGPLAIGHVAGHAKLIATPGQDPSRETAFSVGTMTIAGTTVGFTDKGLQLASGSAPVPDLSALSKVLSDAGVTLTYLPSSQTPTSIESAGIAVGYTTDVPGQGPARVVLTLGRVRAEVTSTTTQQFQAVTGPADDQSSATGPSSSEATPGAPSDSAPLGGGVSGLGRPAIGLPNGRRAVNTGGSATEPAPVDAAPGTGEVALSNAGPVEAPATLTAVGGGRLRHDGDSRLYLVFVVSAAVLVSLSVLFSRQAIRVADGRG